MDAGYDHLFKILLIGNSGVGKTCMLMRFSENQFTHNFYNTIGVDFKIKAMRIEDKNVKLQIWDTAGQDRFRTITCSYYRGAHGILIVYDITDRESFENVRTWMTEIEKHAKQGVQRMLIGNKSDCSDRRKVSFEEGQQLANQYQIPFIEASAKNATNVDIAFTTLSKNMQTPLNQQYPYFSLDFFSKVILLITSSQQQPHLNESNSLNSGTVPANSSVGMKIQPNKFQISQQQQQQQGGYRNQPVQLQQQQQYNQQPQDDCC